MSEDVVTLSELIENIEDFAVKMGVIEDGCQAASLMVVARFECLEDRAERYRVIPLMTTASWAEYLGLSHMAQRSCQEIMAKQERP